MLIFETLSRKHDRESFDCGNAELNSYLRMFASQDVRRRLSVCVVLAEKETGAIYGYYTLSAESDEPDPEVELKSAGAYGSVPVAVLGRLAVDLKYQKQGIAVKLVAHARNTVLSSPIPFVILAVDPLSEKLIPFYRKLGFELFCKEPLRLMLRL